MRRLLTAALLALCLGLAACGGNDEEEATSQATPEPTETAAPAPADPSALADGISKDLDEEPTVEKPAGEPPAELVTEDIVTGKGKTAKAGSTVAVQYTGVSWSTGEKFDASWDRNREAFEFQLGSGMVIPGWDQGVEGMKEGGRRLLVIPADLAYGPAGSPPAIGPNETLVFVVDLEKVS